MTPLERAARALYRSAPHDFDPNQMGEDATWADLIDQVRAVLTAIREPRYYWITDKESNRPPSVAKWDGEYWYFIGSLHMTRDDDVDDDDRSDDPEPIMSRYAIGARIIPPA